LQRSFFFKNKLVLCICPENQLLDRVCLTIIKSSLYPNQKIQILLKVNTGFLVIAEILQRNSETESDYGSEGSVFKMPESTGEP
jgi:hypothetical protein